MNCKRCGECCHYVYNGKRYRCMFLVVRKNSKITTCRIYKTRLGTLINKEHGAYCGSIHDATDQNKQPIKIEGCVYNK